MPGNRFYQRRRQFLRAGLGIFAAAGCGLGLQGCEAAPETSTRIEVPESFVPRIVARSGFRSVAGSEYRWHSAPDGGGCFGTGDGGWIYVSNCEGRVDGGAGALRFDRLGRIVDSYPILTGTMHNCAGGVTPWGTWLSCEEIPRGQVWECDPFGSSAGKPLPALGMFAHESAAVDPLDGRIYLTEDRKDGRLYRFTPRHWSTDTRPDISSGVLEVACVANGRVDWLEVPDPSAMHESLRRQVAGGTKLRGPEGISLYGRTLHFSTKWDNSIWQLDLEDNSLRLFDRLPGRSCRVDNVIHTPNGEVMLAEEGRGMQILYYPNNDSPPVTLVHVSGHRDSEATGIAFEPSGQRLYFSSQRGNTGSDDDGITFEVQGDFDRLPRDLRLTEWVLDHDALPV